MYHYHCQPVRVIDGDTVELIIDLGLHVSVRRIARLRGIDAPEIRNETTRKEGEKSKRRLLELLNEAGDDLACITHLDRQDKYGRVLVSLYPHAAATLSINEKMVLEGMATHHIATLAK